MVRIIKANVHSKNDENLLTILVFLIVIQTKSLEKEKKKNHLLKIVQNTSKKYTLRTATFEKYTL